MVYDEVMRCAVVRRRLAPTDEIVPAEHETVPAGYETNSAKPQKTDPGGWEPLIREIIQMLSTKLQDIGIGQAPEINTTDASKPQAKPLKPAPHVPDPQGKPHVLLSNVSAMTTSPQSVPRPPPPHSQMAQAPRLPHKPISVPLVVPQPPKHQTVTMQEYAKKKGWKYWCDVPGCGKYWNWASKIRYCKVHCTRCRKDLTVRCCKKCTSTKNNSVIICGKVQCPRCKGKDFRKCCQCMGTGTTLSHETLFYKPCSGPKCPFKAVYKQYKNSKVLNQQLAAAKQLGSCVTCKGKGRVSVPKDSKV